MTATSTCVWRARHVLEQMRGGWHAENWIRGLERFAFPHIGSRPVSDINTAVVLEILTPIWHVKAETARGDRGGAGACRPEQGRGGVQAERGSPATPKSSGYLSFLHDK